MSLLTAFTAAASAIASEIIGVESMTISGGSPVSGVMNEASFNRDYEVGGFEQSASLDVVIANAVFVMVYPDPVKTYQGESVSARGESWRISQISKGASFVKISLISSNKSA